MGLKWQQSICVELNAESWSRVFKRGNPDGVGQLQVILKSFRLMTTNTELPGKRGAHEGLFFLLLQSPVLSVRQSLLKVSPRCAMACLLLHTELT